MKARALDPVRSCAFSPHQLGPGTLLLWPRAESLSPGDHPPSFPVPSSASRGSPFQPVPLVYENFCLGNCSSTRPGVLPKQGHLWLISVPTPLALPQSRGRALPAFQLRSATFPYPQVSQPSSPLLLHLWACLQIPPALGVSSNPPSRPLRP